MLLLLAVATAAGGKSLAEMLERADSVLGRSEQLDSAHQRAGRKLTHINGSISRDDGMEDPFPHPIEGVGGEPFTSPVRAQDDGVFYDVHDHDVCLAQMEISRSCCRGGRRGTWSSTGEKHKRCRSTRPS